MNEELINEIKSTLPWLIVAAIAVGGYYGVKNHLAAKKAAASQALVSASALPEAEEAVSAHGSSAAGGALKIRLAKRYFDDGRYDEALGIYDELVKSAPDGFADIPAVGRAQCLEAQGKFAEARDAFAAFAEANPTNYLTLTARLGVFRTTALAGDAAKALEGLAALKGEVGDDEVAKARVESLEDVVRRLPKKE